MTPRPRFLLAAAAVLAGAAAVPAPAPAAYAPKLSVKVDPAQPRKAVALTTTVTQASGESASKKVVLNFPKEFGTVPEGTAVDVKPCSDQQESSGACPAESRLGTARALTMFGEFSGTVHLGQPQADGRIKFVVFLHHPILPTQTLEGFVSVTADGFVSTFDNLPNVATALFELKLDGPPRSLVGSPRDCGTYTFVGHFTSQPENGRSQESESRSPVEITGCPDRAPLILDLEASPNPTRAGRGATLTFSLNEPGAVTVTIARPGSAKALETRTFQGRVGDNRVRRLGRRLEPGRYLVRVRAVDDKGHARVKKTSLRVQEARQA